MMIFDTHAHYDDEAFDADREETIKMLIENGLIGVLNCGASMKGTYASVDLANKYAPFYAAVGIHPENAREFDENTLGILRTLAENPKVLAIGEIGLDYYWEENPPREMQKEIFSAQMKLAGDLNLPVVIHDRDAHEDTLKIMKEFPKVKGEVHCFSGSVEFAKECIKLGYYLGVGGVVTFKNAKKLVEVVKEIPLDYLVVETDAPYMAPTPNRGKRNQSNYIPYIVEKIAEIKGKDKEYVNNSLISNSQKLLKIGR